MFCLVGGVEAVVSCVSVRCVPVPAEVKYAFVVSVPPDHREVSSSPSSSAAAAAAHVHPYSGFQKVLADDSCGGSCDGRPVPTAAARVG